MSGVLLGLAMLIRPDRWRAAGFAAVFGIGMWTISIVPAAAQHRGSRAGSARRWRRERRRMPCSASPCSTICGWRGIALEAIVRRLGSLQAWVIPEWIDRTDGAFEALGTRHGEEYPDYTREHLEREIGRYFHVAERMHIKGGTRTLFELQPRGDDGNATAG